MYRKEKHSQDTVCVNCNCHPSSSRHGADPLQHPSVPPPDLFPWWHNHIKSTGKLFIRLCVQESAVIRHSGGFHAATKCCTSNAACPAPAAPDPASAQTPAWCQGCCHPQNPRGPGWCEFASLVVCVWTLTGRYNHEPVHPGVASCATGLGQPSAGQGHPKSAPRRAACGCPLGKERVGVWQQTWTRGWMEQGRKRLRGSSKTVQQVAHGHAWHRRGCHHVAKAFYSLPSCFAYFCVESFPPSALFQCRVVPSSPWQLLVGMYYGRVLSE